VLKKTKFYHSPTIIIKQNKINLRKKEHNFKNKQKIISDFFYVKTRKNKTSLYILPFLVNGEIASDQKIVPQQKICDPHQKCFFFKKKKEHQCIIILLHI